MTASACGPSSRKNAVLVVAFLAACGGGGGRSSGTLFEERFESFSVGESLLGATWSDPIYEVDVSPWTAATDPDHPERGNVAMLTRWSSLVASGKSWTDYRVSAKVRPTATYTAILGRYGPDGFYVLVLRDGRAELTRGVGTTVLAQQDVVYDSGSYYELAMELEGDTVACFMDGAPLFTYSDPSPLVGGSIGLLGAGGLFDDVVVRKL